MSLFWINITPRLEESISVINSLNDDTFALLLKHILESESDQIVTTKVSEKFKLELPTLQLIVQSIVYIFKQSSKVILKPTVLQEQLIEKLHFHENKADEFVKRWTQEIKKDFDVENAKNLNNFSWELDLESASNHCNQEKHINARLHFNLNEVNGENAEDVTLEMNEEQLGNFYTVLENIQNKLDKI